MHFLARKLDSASSIEPLAALDQATDYSAVRRPPCNSAPRWSAWWLQQPIRPMGDRTGGEPPSEVLAISREILEHLVAEPSAQDTFEGLASWWLLVRELERYGPTLRSATDYLAERRFLKTQRRQDGRIHYSLNASRIDEIREFLEEKQNGCGEGDLD